MPTKLPLESGKKKSGKFFKITLFIIGFLIFGRYLNFTFDVPYLDILYYLHRPMTFEQTMELINPLGPKGYTYPNPSETALNRTVNCDVVFGVPEFPRTNPLCLNIFRTSAEDMKKELTSASYDRIVLYGERSVFDAPVSAQGDKQYIDDLYNAVKFMDLIAIPQYLHAYGLTDVSYITLTKPYPYLYYRISVIDESDKLCRNADDTTEKIQGCARGYFSSVIPVSAVGPQLSSARPILRKSDKKRFSYLTHYPSDCYANAIFTHETAHMLNIAGISETKERVMDTWLTEQIAGFFSIYGDNLACGDGTVSNQRNKKSTDTVKELVAFNAPFAPAALSHDYPEGSTCRQALLSVWYTYLSKGNYQENFRNFFQEQRATTPSLVDDSVFAKLLLRLNPDPSVRTLLVSKGCTL